MKMLCKCLGGSHMYGLNGPESDLDVRGVYASEDMSYILGMDCNDKGERFVEDRAGENDVFLSEIRHYFRGLKKTNSQAIELLFNNKWEHVSLVWLNIQKNKERLIDSERLFQSLMGYLHNEYRLMMGERTGDLGSKRKINLDTYGYSHKNAVQYLRLCYAGAEFFQTGFFPTFTGGMEIYPLLKEIKFHPTWFNSGEVSRYADIAKSVFVNSYENRKITYTFDDRLANDILRDIYLAKYVSL